MYAVLQYFSIDPIDYVVPFESGRVFSTLGNANMLAGYLVLLLPFILERDFRYWRAALCFGILLGVMITGSWTMFALGLGYCVWRFWKDSGLPKFWGVLLVLILSVTCIQIVLEQGALLEGKILSGLTRVELINSGTKLALESVR